MVGSSIIYTSQKMCPKVYLKSLKLTKLGFSVMTYIIFPTGFSI